LTESVSVDSVAATMTYDKANLKSDLELAGHIAAATLVALYVAGFLVITFSDSSHGIVNFGFFRT
jgi:hypothetical protein